MLHPRPEDKERQENLRVGIFASEAIVPREYSEVTSGHVQIAMKTAALLQKMGQCVTLVTTRREGTLPIQIPGLPVKTISRVREKTGLFPPFGAIRQGVELRGLVLRERFDVVHFFGAGKVLLMAFALKTLGIRRCVVTVTRPEDPILNSVLGRKALSSVDAVVGMTSHSARMLEQLGAQNVRVSRPGIMRDVNGGRRLLQGYSVLFWRYGTREDGADLCVEAFRRLSLMKSAVHFLFAVADWSPYLKAMKELEANRRNVRVWSFPYVGVSIRDLLATADLCVIPFRTPSLHPQLSLIESSYSATPVMTTPVGSNAEVIHDRSTGFLVPDPNPEELVSRLDGILDEMHRLRAMGLNGQRLATETWNWEGYRAAIEGVYRQVCS